jgi:hypothetical protein
MIASGMPMHFANIDKTARKAIEPQAQRRAQIAFEASVETLVCEFGVPETITRLKLEIAALTEFER